MRVRFVGGPHDGAYGELQVSWPEPPEQLWLMPDPLHRARWGVIVSRARQLCPRYDLTGQQDGEHLYEFGGWSDRTEAMQHAGTAS